MTTKFILMDNDIYDGEDIYGIYSNRADDEEAFYEFCADWVYEVMITEIPLEVRGSPEWDWKIDYKWLMKECARSLIIVEAPCYD